MEQPETLNAGSLDPVIRSTVECLAKLDDILHSIQGKAQYLSYADQNDTLKASPERIAHEMNQIDTMLDKARVLLFQAHKSPVMLACITELLNQERAWSGGGCHANLTKGVMAAVTSAPNKKLSD
ncbi:MAG: hypothetical protein RLY20_2908 [Verrucomicrobiota bacterium]|jgi:Zn-dependent oligopeptidase